MCLIQSTGPDFLFDKDFLKLYAFQGLDGNLGLLGTKTKHGVKALK